MYISTSVLHELDMAKNMGYDFVQIVFDYIDKEKIYILSMDDEYSDLYLDLPDSFGRGKENQWPYQSLVTIFLTSMKRE